MELPYGLAGNVTATPKCDEAHAKINAAKKLTDACPLSTKVGTVKISVPIVAGETLIVSGQLYNANANPGQPGKMLMYVKDMGAIADNESVLIATPITVVGNAEAIDIEVKIPYEFWSLNLIKIEMRINGSTNVTGTGPFLANQTHCNPAKVEARFNGTYGVYGSENDFFHQTSSPYTATECDQLQFNPSFDVSSSSTVPAAATEISTTIMQEPGEASIDKMELSFKMPFDVGKMPDFCSDDLAFAHNCPQATRIADIEANSWYLPSPLTGTMNMGENLKVYILLDGFIKLTLVGKMDIFFDSGTMKLVLDDLPPMALTEIKAKKVTMFKNYDDCTAASFELKAISHSGQESASKSEIATCADGGTSNGDGGDGGDNGGGSDSGSSGGGSGSGVGNGSGGAGVQIDGDAPTVEILVPKKGNVKPFIKIVGTAKDDKSGVKKVVVAVLVKTRHGCFTLTKKGYKRAKCSARKYLKAKLKGNSWKRKIARRQLNRIKHLLKRKKIRKVSLFARATDKAGNSSKTVKVVLKKKASKRSAR